MRDGISRRSALGFSAGVLAGAMIIGGKSSADATSTTSEALLAPLAVGSRFARWTVAAIHPIQLGALNVLIRAQDGHEFLLEVLARDASALAPPPPAEVGALSIYVSNAGDGWMPTAEEQGLAAMMLARILEANGKGAPVTGLLTHAERSARFGVNVRGVHVHQPAPTPAPAPVV
jgi:hypothetical protein